MIPIIQTYQDYQLCYFNYFINAGNEMCLSLNDNFSLISNTIYFLSYVVLCILLPTKAFDTFCLELELPYMTLLLLLFL